jgi:hypothetical protein
MRRFLTGIGLGLGGIAVVLGLTLGAYAVVGDPIRQPRLAPVSNAPASIAQSPEAEHTPEQNRSPDDHGGQTSGSDDTGPDDHGGNSGSDDSGGSGSDDSSGSGSDNSGPGSSGSGGGDDHGGDD